MLPTVSLLFDFFENLMGVVNFNILGHYGTLTGRDLT